MRELERDAMTWIGDDITVRALLEHAAAERPQDTFALFRGQRIRLGELDRGVNRVANALTARGIRAGDRVGVMLDNHADHARMFFALVKLGAVQVPVNTRLRHDALSYLLRQSDPALLIAEAHYRDAVDEARAGARSELPTIWRSEDAAPALGAARSQDLHFLTASAPDTPPPGEPRPGDVLGILYTSGTTGPPKGVMVTDKMHRACAAGAVLAADIHDGDVLHMWEPFYHVGATQVLIMALEHRITLAMMERFSASRFWTQCREVGATRIHFLGGILQLLLAQPPTSEDRQHDVRIAWGGGAPADAWRAFEARFGVQVRENYGMTEASSLTSANVSPRFATVGTVLPWFRVRIADAGGADVGVGERGEILVREREPGLITPGYFRNDEATRETLRGGWLHTGDHGFLDEDGYLHFLGRLKDCIRRRGENISAWEVEHVVNTMPGIEECAAVAVARELGDEEIKLFLRMVDGSAFDAEAVFRWCGEHLPDYQVPLYLAPIEAFEKTGTERIRKELLSRSVDDAWRRS
jgi:crotonobetaine/carnitine-CoA ligase